MGVMQVCNDGATHVERTYAQLVFNECVPDVQ